MIVARLSAVLAAACIVAGCEGANPSDSFAQGAAAQTVLSGPAGPVPAQSITQSRRTAITTAVERVAPAVVSVQTETVEQAVDPFELFWGGRGARQRARAGIGSGFIIQATGVVVTNAHVVAGASTITVALQNGTTYPATLVGQDDQNDLAVLRVEATGLPVAPIGTPSDLLIGEWTIAIGNPFGFVLGNSEPSVSVGVISAVGRNITAGAEGGMYLDMVQTDAAINPGNSGGPLINANGEVIGVNSSIYSPSGGSVGVGFAIPIDRTMRIVDDLLTHGRVREPWVGIQLQMAPASNARDAVRALPIVGRTAAGSPAARAGVREGDVLVRVGDKPVRNPFDWQARLLEVRVGDVMPLTIRRGNREEVLQLTVADVPEVSAPRVTVLRELELMSVTQQIRAARGIRSPGGALVYNASDRLQAELGLMSGDVIVQIGNTRIDSADLAARAIDAYGARGTVQMWFERDGRLFPPISFRVR